VSDIYLWWIGADAADDAMLREVRSHVEEAFARRVRVWRGPQRPVDAFDPRRQQHSSTRILRWLLTTRPAEAHKTLAITDADLFIPILTFVFGEAQLDGHAAVVSTARLGEGLGPMTPVRVLRARLVKECVHELGHTFGLIHCTRPRCVMSRSVNVNDVDAKAAALCQDCRARYLELEERGTKAHD
jgi:archaemetzincin